MHAVDDGQRVIDADLRIGLKGEGLLGHHHHHGILFGKGELAAQKGVHVHVGKMMHDCFHTPTTLTIRQLQLSGRYAADQCTQAHGRVTYLFLPLRDFGFTELNGAREFSDGILQFYHDDSSTVDERKYVLFDIMDLDDRSPIVLQTVVLPRSARHGNTSSTAARGPVKPTWPLRR